MCVRYTLHQPDAALAAVARALARLLAAPAGLRPRYNLTVSDVVPAVTVDGGQPRVRAMAWGLRPGPEFKLPPRPLPNAKAEKAATSPVFRQAVARRRCLIPANGFYEWRAAGQARLPHLFTLPEEEPFALAGIWDPPAEDGRPPTFAVLTTGPNALMAPIHHRMPVILAREAMPRWLGTEPLAEAEYLRLTRPLPADRLRVRPVSSYVNQARHEGPPCHAPAEPLPEELPLDFG
ncbi:MAG: SOS response-associated peptidase [Opitutaceae bacterium]|nr:SOS response-associated peptidase [Opitutaceae bacterium]